MSTTAATNTTTETAAETATPVGSLRVPCPLCHAEVGAGCVSTTRGTPTRRPHFLRFEHYWGRLSGGFIARVKTTNPQLRVTAGELYEARPYPFDNEKVTLLRRVPDGYDPGCNHYWSDIEWVRWEA